MIKYGKQSRMFGMKRPHLKAVARAFVLAYRVMDVIIKEDGNNDFLSNGTSHCNVRRDYKDTTTGIKPMLANFMF